MKIKEIYRRRASNLLEKGKISWLEPVKLGRQSVLDALIDAKKYAKGVLLDAGCGDKPHESIFSGFVDGYIGIDLPISKSANKLEKRADIYGSILDMPFKSNSFDTVLSTQVLEHVPEPKKNAK